MWPFKKKSEEPDWYELHEAAERECYAKTSEWLGERDWNWKLRDNSYIRSIMIAEGIEFPCHDKERKYWEGRRT